MGHNLTAAVKTEFAKGIYNPRLLALFDFPSGMVPLWTGNGTLTWTGDSEISGSNAVYNGVEGLWGFTGIKENAKGIAESVGIFMLIQNTMITRILGEDFQERPATIWLAALSTPAAVIADPIRLAIGKMDNAEMTKGADYGRIDILIENRFFIMEGKSNRRYTDQDQKRFFPLDGSLRFINDMQGRPIFFGRHDPSLRNQRTEAGEQELIDAGGIIP